MRDDTSTIALIAPILGGAILMSAALISSGPIARLTPDRDLGSSRSEPAP